MEQLHGRVGVVTGAASGIGKAVATALAAQGMKVVLSDIEQTVLDAAVGELADAGHEVLGVRTDVASWDAVQSLAAATMDHFGAVHVVHNNAGVVSAGAVEELTLDTWSWVLGVDLWSVIYGIKAFLPLIRAQGEGHIVSTASTAGLQANAGIAPYNVAKFGVVALSETLRLELDQAGSPIGCSVLCPGSVNTRIVFADRNRPAGDHVDTEVHEQFKARAGQQLATVGLDPADVAAMVVDGIRTNRFWILTHDPWYGVLADRVAAMADDGRLHHGFGG
jgi:NAD(P)-dependent dehydrogenase (short-subunit alcohol dehydrogenase family)